MAGNNSEALKRYWDQRSWELLGRGGRRTRVIKEQDMRCATCGIGEWMGEEIALELDHINGNNVDNSRDNLRALCGNCHRQTPTYGHRNRLQLKYDGQFKVGGDSRHVPPQRPNQGVV